MVHEILLEDPLEIDCVLKYFTEKLFVQITKTPFKHS